MIPENIIEEIRERSDIVEVISSYIPLKRSGRNFKALCPFHREKTPSFLVSPEKQIFHCFGCGVGGNVFHFLMRQEGMSFMEAVRSLGEKTGVSLPSPLSPSQRSRIQSLYKLNQLACDYFHHLLMETEEGKRAYEYLRKRGVEEESMRRFRLGYAPASLRELIQRMEKGNFPPSLGEEVGLLLPLPGGGVKPYFRRRIIFPIFNVRGKVIGFGGRVLDDASPKYLNSPSTPLYNKSKTLYGLNFSREAILGEGIALIVEGYMDLLTLFQAGVRNTVASLGTSLTPDQVRMLKNYVREVKMLYDPDAAGIKATVRGLDFFLEEGIAVKVVPLPPGYDPDSFIRKKGIGEFRKLLDKAQDLLDFQLSFLRSQYNYQTLEGKLNIIAELLPTLNKVGDAVRKGEYIRRLAGELSIGEGALWEKIRKLSRGERKEEPLVEITLDPRSNLEKYLLQLAFVNQTVLKKVKKRLKADDFSNPFYRAIISTLFQKEDNGSSLNYAWLMENLPDDDSRRAASEILLRDVPHADIEKEAEDCIRKIEKSRWERELKRIGLALQEAGLKGEKGEMAELKVQYQKVFNAWKGCLRSG